mmetsp:Transcript_106149/g.288043  ORF Transcript_106149/g.288043 Transcript_106149/m.288043 type:complete len:261 (+) Transcript_106149:966-1748(+)
MPSRPSAAHLRAGCCSASSLLRAASCLPWPSWTALWKARRTRRISWPRRSASATSSSPQASSSPSAGQTSALASGASHSRSTPAGPSSLSSGISLDCRRSRRSRAAPQLRRKDSRSASSTSPATSAHSASRAPTRSRSRTTWAMALPTRAPSSASASSILRRTLATMVSAASAQWPSDPIDSTGSEAPILQTSLPCAARSSCSILTTGRILALASCRAALTPGRAPMPLPLAKSAASVNRSHAAVTFLMACVPIYLLQRF